MEFLIEAKKIKSFYDRLDKNYYRIMLFMVGLFHLSIMSDIKLKKEQRGRQTPVDSQE